MEPSTHGSPSNAAAEPTSSTATSPYRAAVRPTAPKRHESMAVPLRLRRATAHRSQSKSARQHQHHTDTPSSSATTSPITVDEGAHASDVVPVPETSDSAKPVDVKPSQSTTKSTIKLAETRNSAIRSRKARAKSYRPASPAPKRLLSGTRVATEEGTATAGRSPESPTLAEMSGDDEEEARPGVPAYAPVIATDSLLRPMLKVTASTALPTGGGLKCGSSVDGGALASESPAVSFLRYAQCVDSLARGAMNISPERPSDNQAPEYYFGPQVVRTAYAALSASYATERLTGTPSGAPRSGPSFAASACSRAGRARPSLDPASVSLRSPAVPARVSCLLPMLNIPEFVEAFECCKTAPAC